MYVKKKWYIFIINIFVFNNLNLLNFKLLIKMVFMSVIKFLVTMIIGERMIHTLLNQFNVKIVKLTSDNYHYTRTINLKTKYRQRKNNVRGTIENKLNNLTFKNIEKKRKYKII